MANASETPRNHLQPPSLVHAAGVLLLAGALLAVVLLLVEGPFVGPWRVVLAVAVFYAAVYVGCLTVGCRTGAPRARTLRARTLRG
ncbi:MAG TPA: hypothetical protein VD995_34115 [Azospirillum sp.]|nr:hypothetical protein [Azospirillum sp.]